MSCKLDSTFFTGKPWLEQRPDPVAVRVTTALAPLAAAMPTISVTSPHANPASASLLLLPFIYNHPPCLFLTPLPYLLILVSFGLFLTFMFFICFHWFCSSSFSFHLCLLSHFWLSLRFTCLCLYSLPPPPLILSSSFVFKWYNSLVLFFCSCSYCFGTLVCVRLHQSWHCAFPLVIFTECKRAGDRGCGQGGGTGMMVRSRDRC